MAKLNGKDLLGPDNPGTVSAYDEKFAQSAEAVDTGKPDPGNALIEAEGERILAALEEAAERHAALVRLKADPVEIRAAEYRYDKLAAVWAEFQDGGQSLGELRSGRADRFEPKTLTDYMTRDLNTGELLPEDVQEIIRESWFRILGFVFDGWNCNIGLGFKALLASVRRTNPQYLHDQGLTQREVSIILGETKANVSAREKKVIEKKLAAAGMRGVRLLGDTKPDSTRRKCAEAQRGNTNRSTGTRRKRACA